MAMSKDDIRALIKEGVIKKKQKKGISSARVKKLKEQRKRVEEEVQVQEEELLVQELHQKKDGWLQLEL